MFLTVKQKLKHLSKTDYKNLRLLTRAAKDLTNQAIYCCRQYFFAEGKYLNYQKVYAELKTSENYRINNANMSQQTLKEVDGMFKSFFALRKYIRSHGLPNKMAHIPHYLPKDGYATLVIAEFAIHDGEFVLPYSRTFNETHEKIRIKVPPVLDGKNIKEIRIIPRNDARFFEVQYTYKVEAIAKEETDQTKALAIDLGVNNLMTCVTTDGDSFIVDGRKLKSVNQWYNKENARLQRIKDKQKFGKKLTQRQVKNLMKRNNRVNNYISKACRIVIDYCRRNKVGILVCGYNVTFQRSPRLGKQRNQSFVNIPFGKIRDKLQYLCAMYGIRFVEQEESYTSKSSFWDKDRLPVYNNDNPKEYKFRGRRVKRGLYRTAEGRFLNADVNGALNILRKSSVVDLSVLYGRGDVNTPMRIRVPA